LTCNQSVEKEDNGTAAMFVPNSKEVNEIILLKGDQQAVAHIIASQEYRIVKQMNLVSINILAFNT
jgi:hypothetical protein